MSLLDRHDWYQVYLPVACLSHSKVKPFRLEPVFEHGHARDLEVLYLHLNLV